MSTSVPNRSARGCLTCKQRKKKCDEKKPACERCIAGNFQCLGYSHLDSHKSSAPRRWQPRSSERATHTRLLSGSNSDQDTQSTESSPDLGYSLDTLGGASRNNDTLIQPQECLPLVAQLYEQPLYIPGSIELDPLEVDNMVQVIVSQYGRLANRVQFRPFQFSLEQALARRAQSSSLVRSTMYLGARIAQALLDDTNSQAYVGWIDGFHRKIVGSEIVSVKQDTVDIAHRLAALQDLAFYAFMVLNSSSGYALFRKCIPPFLQLVARYPQVWADNSAISIHRALHAPRHEIIKFVFIDTIASLAFGVIPLIHYDTTLPIPTADDEPERDIFLEWVFACPPILIVLIARINSSRISRVMNQHSTTTNEVEIKQIEEALREWKPRIDYDDQPPNLIARMAIQECWRQSALIYLYMGMCSADSADERVQLLVKQVVQLATTVETGSQLETHLFIPCLIVGAAARKEKHRSVVRRKVQASRNADACILRGADFAFVLDHLWHGAAAGGAPTTWEDYVNSRCATLPVEI